MDKSCEIIDLCVKSEKSDDTSTTVPLDDNPNTEENLPTNNENLTYSKIKYTEQWIDKQNEIAIPVFNEPPTTEIPPANISVQDVAVAIPTEIAGLVHEDSVIKLINHLVLYAFNKVTEADLHQKMVSVTPDFDPQLNYRISIGFQFIYERCVVLFYESLLVLTQILSKFTPPHQGIVLLWMYDTVESISRAHGVDSSFLRNEKYIEALLKDFADSNTSVPTPENIFYNVYQKMQPQEIIPNENQLATAANGPPKKRKKRGPRQPRAKNNQKDVIASSS